MNYDRRHKTARGQRLEPATRSRANRVLSQRGLDGNDRFRKVGQALTVAFDVLSEFGIEPGETLNSHLFMEPSGTRSLELAFSNPDDPFSPTEVSNSVLFFSWTELRDGVFEVIAYLS